MLTAGSVALAASLFGLHLSTPPSAGAQTRRALALVGGTVYESPTAVPLFDAAVVLADGKIAAVGPREKVAVPAGAAVIDCAGAVILAGFQNSHVHFTEEKWVDAAHQDPARLSSNLAAMLTRFGFTTVVDTASLLSNTAALRRRIESGEVAGPRVYTAGEGLYPPKGVPYYVRDSLPADVVNVLPQPSTASDAVDVVRQHVEGGADVLKLFTGSWVVRGKVLPMPTEIAVAASAEMHRRGRLVFAHESNVAGLRVALDAGVDVLAHGIDDSRGLTAEDRARMRRQNVAVIPTLKLFDQGRYLFDVLDEVRDYSRSGGQILFGTDIGYLTAYDPTEEYVLMASAGLGWREILASLTTSPADRFGEAGRRGKVSVGMDADLVILDADPVKDVRAFAKIRQTIRGGTVLYSKPRD
ncbi:MAG: amidohydrolase family protein [Acidobacteriota bacterium]|nr:amidohydrolase family protein [Acidobacteriota bacterium]